MTGIVLMGGLLRDDAAGELIFSGRVLTVSKPWGLPAYDTGLQIRATKPLPSRKRWPPRAPMRSALASRSSHSLAENHQHAILLAEITEQAKSDWTTQSGRGGPGEFGEGASRFAG